MIFIFSNRNIINNNTWLGDDFNEQGNENMRIAKYVGGINARLNFYEENQAQTLPSEQVIHALEQSDKPCCIFIHGYNQSLQKNIDKCKEIESFGVNVVAFSWPSNPGPAGWVWKLKEYKRARQNATRSSVALERFFDKFNDHVLSSGQISNIQSLVVHSLGNYLFQSFVGGVGFAGQTAFLKNILLHQADVDSLNHEHWADKLIPYSRVMATINETDDVLDVSDIINPDRLGNTLQNLNSAGISYFNFGQLNDADDQHRLWIAPVIDNLNAKLFFTEIFNAKNVKTGHFNYDSGRNCYHVK